MRPHPHFIGRERELEWLHDRLSRTRWYGRILITGVAGVGKTTLVREALSRFPIWGDLGSPNSEPLWFDVPPLNQESAIATFIQTVRERGRRPPGSNGVVVLDNADAATNDVLERVIGRLSNLKVVRSLVVIGRNVPDISRAETLHVHPLDMKAAEHLLRALAQSELTPNAAATGVQATLGNPLAISLLARLVGAGGSTALGNLLALPIYDVSRIAPPDTDIITVARPAIVTATHSLVERLKNQPSSLHELSPRQFEEVLAELLTGMGWEVELTQQTRDGGKDLLAYLQTDVGRLLCLVEAKRYRRDRTVGVDLVRGLYGTLCDHQANSAMLVTTSSFSPDAREFQQKHQYQLSLKDYADVVEWVRRHDGHGAV